MHVTGGGSYKKTPEARSCEARKAESTGGVLGSGGSQLPPPLRGSGTLHVRPLSLSSGLISSRFQIGLSWRYELFSNSTQLLLVSRDTVCIKNNKELESCSLFYLPPLLYCTVNANRVVDHILQLTYLLCAQLYGDVIKIIYIQGYCVYGAGVWCILNFYIYFNQNSQIENLGVTLANRIAFGETFLMIRYLQVWLDSISVGWLALDLPVGLYFQRAGSVCNFVGLIN